MSSSSLVACDDTSKLLDNIANSSQAQADNRPQQTVVINPETKRVTPKQIEDIAKLKAGCNQQRAGTIKALGTPYAQLPSSPQSNIVYQYLLESDYNNYATLVLGFTDKGCYVGYGFHYNIQEKRS